MAGSARIEVPLERVAEFCGRHGIARMALFGSVLRADFGPDSDVDVLVEFLEGRTPGLGFFRLQDELSELFGRRVDLHTPASLSPPIRAVVLEQAMTIHDAA